MLLKTAAHCGIESISVALILKRHRLLLSMPRRCLQKGCRCIGTPGSSCTACLFQGESMRVTSEIDTFVREKRTLWSVLFLTLTLLLGSAFHLQAEEGDTENNQPPGMVDFQVSYLGNDEYAFSGTVSDEDPSMCSVEFRGLSQTVIQVEADGAFTHVEQFEPGTTGDVAATATDSDGLTSNTLTEIIF